MNNPLCVYSPGPWGNCVDVGCGRNGGRCEYVGGKRARSKCVCRTREPSRNLGQEGGAVEVMDLYRAKIADVPKYQDPAFGDLLRQFRAGDEAAGRAITGGHLGMALALVETLPEPPAGLKPIDAVQEANAGLWEALVTFPGATADEFADHARRAVMTWLANLEPEQG